MNERRTDDTSAQNQRTNESTSRAFGIFSESTSLNNIESQCIQQVFGLRWKTMVVLVIVFLLTTLIFLAILLSVSLTIFNRVEVDATREATRRISRAFYDHIDRQLSGQGGYADWDVTYNMTLEYTPQRFQEWIDYNYYFEYMRDSHKVNMVLVYTLNGTLMGGTGYNLTTGETLEIPDELLELSEDHPLIKGMNDTSTLSGGYMLVGKGTMLLVTAYPIQDSLRGTTQSNGVLVYVEFVTGDFTQNIADRSQLCLNLYTSAQKNDPDVSKYSSQFGRTTGTLVNVVDPNWEQNNVFEVTSLDISSKSVVSGRKCWLNDGEITSKEPRVATYQAFTVSTVTCIICI